MKSDNKKAGGFIKMGRRQKIEIYIPGSDKYYSEREALKKMVKSFYDFQDLRLRQSGRMAIKADGTRQADNGTRPLMSEDAKEEIKLLWENVRKTENEFSHAIQDKIKHFPEWEYYLKDVTGCGPMLAAVLISEIDIVKAVTPSKIEQFAGLNANFVRGKKLVNGAVVVTDELIRGDRKKAGFLAPYNAFLKKKILHTLSGSFIKFNGEYSKIYYDFKNRYENSRNHIGNDESASLWCDTTKSHRHRAAIRKMMGIFIIDYYKNVRAIWGLPTRPSYAEEYLGLTHNDPKWTNAINEK